MFRAEIVESEAAETAGQRVFVDADSIGPCVRIRNWKPGDYYRPVGITSRKAQETVSTRPDSKKSPNKLAGDCRRFDDYLGSLISRFPRICSLVDDPRR